MSKPIISTGELPVGMEINEIYPMVQATGSFEFRPGRNTEELMLEKIKEELINKSPEEANAIIGVKVTTTANNYPGGSTIFATYIGTPAIIIEK